MDYFLQKPSLLLVFLIFIKEHMLHLKATNSPRECKDSWTGKSYRGKQNVTKSGKMCQRWDSQIPHKHDRNSTTQPNAGLDWNYCRNPDGESCGPWCYTMSPDTRWEDCAIELCPYVPDCKETIQGIEYRGKVNVSKSGIPCQRWNSQTAFRHSYTPENYPGRGLEDNYCRNPDYKQIGPWCYITSSLLQFEACHINLCTDKEAMCPLLRCHQNASCIIQYMTTVCQCNQGFSGDGKVCEDIDECASPTTNNCQQSCDNTDGSFQCSCFPGYVKTNATHCTDDNECLRDSCHVNGTCYNTIGSYTCSCNNGFSGDGTSCLDLNECDNVPCKTNEICANTIGSYICPCDNGFTRSGTSCMDQDECQSAPCHSDATCHNIIGSYTCSCNTGYTGNGTVCVDREKENASTTVNSASGMPIITSTTVDSEIKLKPTEPSVPVTYKQAKVFTASRVAGICGGLILMFLCAAAFWKYRKRLKRIKTTRPTPKHCSRTRPSFGINLADVLWRRKKRSSNVVYVDSINVDVRNMFPLQQKIETLQGKGSPLKGYRLKMGEARVHTDN